MRGMETIARNCGGLPLALPAALPEKARILVACSGGSDSVALALALREAGFAIVLAHVQHHLRRRAAEADARFVEQFAKSLSVPFSRADADVKALQREKSLSLEMAAREARHAALVAIARRRRIRFVAFAHHRRDQAETVLLALARGAGPRAIGAMSPAREDASGLVFLRPLLAVPKEDILSFLAARKQTFRTDKTNTDGSSLRSRVRTRVLPLLAETLNPRVEEALSRVAEIARADDEALSFFARTSPLDFPALARRRALAALPPRATFREAEAVLPRFGKNAEILPNIGKTGSARGIWLLPRLPRVSDFVPATGFERTDSAIYLDAASVKGKRLSFRRPRPGDRLALGGKTGGSKKLSDIFINEKVPRALRAKAVVLAVDGELAALAGYRVAPAFRVPSPDAPSIVLRRPR